MTPSYPIWTSGNTDAIVPQIYNWAQADRGEQTANIGRRTDWDRQAIQNRNNYFQIQQQQEAQDYARSQAVQQENYRRQQEAEREALAKYKFAEDQKLSREYLTKQDEWANAKRDTQALNDNFKITQDFQKAQDDARAALRENLIAGKFLDTPPNHVAQMFGLLPEEAASMQSEHQQGLPEKAMEQARMELAQLRAKDPAKFTDKANLDAIENYLKLKLPVGIRDKVYLDRDKLDLVRTDYRFTPSRGVQMQQQGYSNPGSGPAVNYNFGAPPTTGTMPAPAPPSAPPVLAPKKVVTADDVKAAKETLDAVREQNPTQSWKPSKDEGIPVSDYFGGGQAKIAKAIDEYASTLKAFKSPTNFILMRNPDGQTVKVPMTRVDEFRNKKGYSPL